MANTNPGTTDGGSAKREQGMAISFIGLAVLVLDLLIIFFAPAGFRIGQRSVFVALIVILAAIGLVLVFVGRSQRRAAS